MRRLPGLVFDTWDHSFYRQASAESIATAPVLFVAFCTCIVLGSVLSVAFIVVIGALVAGLSDTVVGGHSSTAADHVDRLLVAASALLLAQPFLVSAQSMITRRLARRVDVRLRTRVMGAALAPATVSHLFDAEIAEEIDAATTVGTARMGPQSAIEAWNPVLASLVTGLAMCAVVTVFRWWLGLLLAAAWYLARRLRWRQSTQYLNTLGSESIGTRRQAYFRLLGTTPPAAKEIRVFGLSRWLTERFHEQWLVGIEPTWTLRRSRRSSLAVTLVVLVAVNVLAVLVVADTANTGAIGVGTLTLLLQAILGAGSCRNRAP